VASGQEVAGCIATICAFEVGGAQWPCLHRLRVLAMLGAYAFSTLVVFLLSFANGSDPTRAFSMGASGVVPKDGALRSLAGRLRQVMFGQQVVRWRSGVPPGILGSRYWSRRPPAKCTIVSAAASNSNACGRY
jgi:hypothetical protein